jgi:hypothetical protein
VSTAIAASVCAGFDCKTGQLCKAAVDKSCRFAEQRCALFLRALINRIYAGLNKFAVGLGGS